MKPLLRGVLAAAVPLAVAAAGRMVLAEQVKLRLREIDPEASFEEFSPGIDAVYLGGLSLPGMGICADSVWVSLSGVPFSTSANSVTVRGGTVDPFSGDEGSGSRAEEGPILSMSVQDATLPDGSALFASRIGGSDLIASRGPWGRMTIRRQNGEFTGVFSDLRGFPMQSREIPSMLQGHSVSGFCSGELGDSASFSGRITGFDGGQASARFLYSCREGSPRAEFSMDFSEVGEPALALLDSLSGGAVMTAVPAGSLMIALDGPDSVFFETALCFDSLIVFSEAVAPDTFATSAYLSCSGFALPSRGTLSVDSGLVRIGGAEARFRLFLLREPGRRLVLDLWSDSLTGEAITGSVPTELMGRLQGLSLGGHASFFVNLVLDWDHPDSCDINIDLDATGLFVAWSPISFSALMESGATCTMRDSWGNARIIGLDTLQNENFVVYDSIPFFFEPLLCCAEDASFRRHHGFSEYHIRNSIRADMEQGRFVRGGSTISMQLAKNLFLGREKTLARKLQEVFLTWRLERWLTKDRILELYANVVELGPGVFGFNSAGLYYFNKPFGELSVRETAFLVSILPGPSVYHRFGVRGELPQYWDAYVERLITICGSRGWLEQRLVSEALSDTLIFRGPVTEFNGGAGGSHSN